MCCCTFIMTWLGVLLQYWKSFEQHGVRISELLFSLQWAMKALILYCTFLCFEDWIFFLDMNVAIRMISRQMD